MQDDEMTKRITSPFRVYQKHLPEFCVVIRIESTVVLISVEKKSEVHQYFDHIKNLVASICVIPNR